MKRNHLTSRDVALVAIFAGITAALALVPAIPIGPVPITAQSLGPILAGAILGGRRGAASQLLFLTLVALGLPLLAGGRGGLGVFVGPTVGFLLGFIVSAAFIGWATYRVGAPYRIASGLAINFIGGIVVLYLLGGIGMLVVLPELTVSAAALTFATYLPGDLVKVVIATVIAKGVHTAYPGLLPRTGSTPTVASSSYAGGPTASQQGH